MKSGGALLHTRLLLQQKRRLLQKKKGLVLQLPQLSQQKRLENLLHPQQKRCRLQQRRLQQRRLQQNHKLLLPQQPQQKRLEHQRTQGRRHHRPLRTLLPLRHLLGLLLQHQWRKLEQRQRQAVVQLARQLVEQEMHAAVYTAARHRTAVTCMQTRARDALRNHRLYAQAQTAAGMPPAHDACLRALAPVGVGVGGVGVDREIL